MAIITNNSTRVNPCFFLNKHVFSFMAGPFVRVRDS